MLFQMKDTSLLNYVTVSDISSSTTAPKISKFTSETPTRYRWTFSFRPSPLFCFIFPISILTLHSDELSLYVEFNSLTLFHIYIYYINTTQKTYKTLPVPHKAPSSDFLVNISPKGPLQLQNTFAYFWNSIYRNLSLYYFCLAASLACFCLFLDKFRLTELLQEQQRKFSYTLHSVFFLCQQFL